ncbi:MarR family winged helix-turn-helix transcriptional regulator [Streptomyces sp. NBC_00237]|uniref:MarR family winged helix-turn-helix transcriptional regulator n=1 Tax=Streptomyces sp. NBC_00237 TaxID=2975687 RepID=UPI0022556700|nr:MarR family winged helix-turn-helix transcriptional regulator [Streptomyces sp. NBC_00237]MCX5204094.1 MarR family winged helix-turn-helix transcriptional regulator [Streptomyces sp. NBC_00237]
MTSEPRWLTASEQRTWQAYRRMQLLLGAQVSRDLAADSRLSDADYDVLSHLSYADGNRCRISGLADRMLWSRSRLSHHLTRMQQRGLVVREGCASDARCAEVVLTDEGLRTLEAAAPPHVESVRRNFIDLLTPEQQAAFAEIGEVVVRHLSKGREPTRAPKSREAAQSAEQGSVRVG